MPFATPRRPAPNPFADFCRHSRKATRTGLLFAVASLGGTAAVQAQNLSIQQPAFGTNSVGTTVSVPDRGQAHLGGVGRAASSRNWSGGPLRSGSNLGLSREHGSSSTRVWIHDFEEMDRQLLNEGDVPLSRATQNREFGIRSPDPLPVIRPDSRSNKADEYYEKALTAERENKPLVARMFYRWAIQYGSQRAALNLARMERDKPSVALKSKGGTSRSQSQQFSSRSSLSKSSPNSNATTRSSRESSPRQEPPSR